MRLFRLTPLTCLLFVGTALLYFSGCTIKKKESRILVFIKTAGFKHSSIPVAAASMIEEGKKRGLIIDTTSKADFFFEENLKRYSAIVWLHTTGNVLNASQKAAFQRYIQAGGGFVGIHSATDTEYFWEWYGKMVGAYFENHPEIQPAKIKKSNVSHPSTAMLPAVWERTDEWYNFKLKSLNPNVSVLLSLDESSYKGGKMGENHPISWFHDYDGGRAFYTGLGHTEESWKEQAFIDHLWGGINSVLAKELNYEKAYTLTPPDENRFTKKVLIENLNEPCELAVSKAGEVFFVQRKGELYYMNPSDSKVNMVQKFDVWHKYEDGLLGITLDPDFENNKWAYVFYSPNIPEWVQYVSRFTWNGNQLVDEKVMLKIPVQRTECCHSAGSLTFGPDKVLYISTGDNTYPHVNSGYAPTDDRPGREPYDAQKSSANTNDLRGKILRIKPEADGTYSIPNGNLFPKDGKQGRPEIFTMGCRNPYRISVDPDDGTVYWGDIGPDAGKDSIQGPKGHDEFNFARTPGNYGWPYFIGNNKPYKAVRFDTFLVGNVNNVQKPINNSLNNTGSKTLPPARPALIYYPYIESEEFPFMAKGGRSAMAGPVYKYDPNLVSDVKFPKYFHNKVFFYEWMRNLFFTLQVDKAGKIQNLEPVFTTLPLNKVIDMEWAPDGSLYALEYGTLWFSENPDARLIKIEYSANNRTPVAKASVNETVGKQPFKVNFSSLGSFDLDPFDSLKYEWRIANTNQVISREANPTYTFNKAGNYRCVLIVTDKEGNSATSAVNISVGNAIPKVEIQSEDNKTFYWSGVPLKYNINVTDQEDGSLKEGSISNSAVTFTSSYLAEGEDLTIVAQGHQLNKNDEPKEVGASDPRAALIAGSDCKACHHPQKRSVGPSWEEIAVRYKGQAGINIKLAKKVISGGAGVWGDHAMSSHPQLSLKDATSMVEYIMEKLPKEKQGKASLPLAGTLTFKDHKPTESNGKYYLTVEYKDKGAKDVLPITQQHTLILRNPKVEAESFDQQVGIKKRPESNLQPARADFVGSGKFLNFQKIDLTNVSALRVRYSSEMDLGRLEVHADSAKGELLGSLNIKNTGKFSEYTEEVFKIKPTKGAKNLYFVYVNDNWVEKKLPLSLDWIYFSTNATATLASR